MHSDDQKVRRSQEYKDLRELHRLYNKCQPVQVYLISPHEGVGMCTCGRLMEATLVWHGNGTRGFRPMTHATKRRLRRLDTWKATIKALTALVFHQGVYNATL